MPEEAQVKQVLKESCFRHVRSSFQNLGPGFGLETKLGSFPAIVLHHC